MAAANATTVDVVDASAATATRDANVHAHVASPPPGSEPGHSAGNDMEGGDFKRARRAPSKWRRFAEQADFEFTQLNSDAVLVSAAAQANPLPLSLFRARALSPSLSNVTRARAHTHAHTQTHTQQDAGIGVDEPGHMRDKAADAPHALRFSPLKVDLRCDLLYIYTYTHMCVCVCVCMYMYIYIYIYMYMTLLRGNHWSNTTGLTHVFFKHGELYSNL